MGKLKSRVDLLPSEGLGVSERNHEAPHLDPSFAELWLMIYGGCYNDSSDELNI